MEEDLGVLGAESDTYVIKNGKIVAQTFAGKIVPKQ
jgi:hypothetical protein